MQQLGDRIQELESDVASLTEELQIKNEQLQEMQATAPILDSDQFIQPRDRQKLLAARDRILKNWRLAKAPEKKERIKEAMDRLIEAIEQEI